MPLDYSKAGVSIDAGNRLVDLIKPLARATRREGVVSDVGGFGGLFALDIAKYKNPILVAGADGVGTKLKVAIDSGILNTVGIDLVAMNVNDILTVGAEPLFFLDYFATSKLDPAEAASVIEGMAEGCSQAGCCLLGGETAELPGFYLPKDFDVAGFAVGVVDKEKTISGHKNIKAGDKIVAIASSGLHSNGFSLARKIFFDAAGLKVDSPSPVEEGKTVAQTMLTPTIIYVKPILNLVANVNVHGLAHITGGGLLENIPRIMPKGTVAWFDKTALKIPQLFHWMQAAGGIEWKEMFRVFNCGTGMIAVVADSDVHKTLDALNGCGFTAYVAGEIREGAADAAPYVDGLL